MSLRSLILALAALAAISAAQVSAPAHAGDEAADGGGSCTGCKQGE